MEQKRQIKKLTTVYTAIIKRLGEPAFKFSEGGATQKTLANFIGMLAEKFGSVTEERLVDVCVFLAYIYRQKRLPVKSTFGKSSLSYFFTSKRGQRHYENEWLEMNGMSRSSLLKLIADNSKHPLAEFIYMPSEEHRKFRLLNQRSGYVLCQASTMGWSPKSEACGTCRFVEECKTATEIKFPELYRIRLENDNKPNNGTAHR